MKDREVEKEDVMIRKRKSTMSQLTLKQKITIVHEVVVGRRGHADVAHDYNVKAAVVGLLVRKAKHKSGYFEKLHLIERGKEEANESIETQVE